MAAGEKQENNEGVENKGTFTDDEERTTWPFSNLASAGDKNVLSASQQLYDATTVVNVRVADERNATKARSALVPTSLSLEPADSAADKIETAEKAARDPSSDTDDPQESNNPATGSKALLAQTPPSRSFKPEGQATDDGDTVVYKAVEFKGGLQSDSSDSEREDGEDEDHNDMMISDGQSPYFMITDVPQTSPVASGSMMLHSGDSGLQGGANSNGFSEETRQEAQPIDPTVLQDIEIRAYKAAGNLDYMMMNLRNSLYAMTVCMRQMSEIHNEAFGNMQKTVDMSTKSMYSFLAKFEELNNSLEPLKHLSSQISDISETLKTLERQFKT